MATVTFPAWCHTRCSAKGEIPYNSFKGKLNGVKVNGTPTTWSPIKVDVESSRSSLDTTATPDQIASVGNYGCLTKRQKIPAKKQFSDPYRQGVMVEGGVAYRQTVVIRSCEVGPDKTATIESVLNLFQETALGHVWMSGLLGDGFGATHEMMKNNLIWVVSRMQVQVDHYPIWGEVVEIDTWVAASGKNGMRRDWLIRSQANGTVYARATSTWVMMNRQTRRLSKIPEAVRDELSPWFIDNRAIKEDVSEKIVKLDNKAKYIISDLKPKRTDLDMNQHVNNVKYVGWMLENIPDHVLESHQLSSITMEYRRECGVSDVVQSLCEPNEAESFHHIMNDKLSNSLLNEFSVASEIINGGGLMLSIEKIPITYTHLLQTEGNNRNEELVRGKTAWKKKTFMTPFST